MHCGHVVLFDFPRDPSEYVRRVGRTARGANGSGVVTALVLGRQVGKQLYLVPACWPTRSGCAALLFLRCMLAVPPSLAWSFHPSFFAVRHSARKAAAVRSQRRCWAAR